jgi:hypothetical protein
LVVAGKRADLDFDVALPAALAAQLIERLLVGRVGEREPAGEDARVVAADLARVEAGGRDLRLCGADLDAAAEKARAYSTTTSATTTRLPSPSPGTSRAKTSPS